MPWVVDWYEQTARLHERFAEQAGQLGHREAARRAEERVGLAQRLVRVYVRTSGPSSES
jgi:hypothetical protein